MLSNNKETWTKGIKRQFTMRYLLLGLFLLTLASASASKESCSFQCFQTEQYVSQHHEQHVFKVESCRIGCQLAADTTCISVFREDRSAFQACTLGHIFSRPGDIRLPGNINAALTAWRNPESASAEPIADAQLRALLGLSLKQDESSEENSEETFDQEMIIILAASGGASLILIVICCCCCRGFCNYRRRLREEKLSERTILEPSDRSVRLKKESQAGTSSEEIETLRTTETGLAKTNPNPYKKMSLLAEEKKRGQSQKEAKKQPMSTLATMEGYLKYVMKNPTRSSIFRPSRQHLEKAQLDVSNKKTVDLEEDEL